MNCILAGMRMAMGPFERSCLRFYEENVNDFTMAAGIVSGDFRALRLKGVARRLFKEAMQLIYKTSHEVAVKRAE